MNIIKSNKIFKILNIALALCLASNLTYTFSYADYMVSREDLSLIPPLLTNKTINTAARGRNHATAQKVAAAQVQTLEAVDVDGEIHKFKIGILISLFGISEFEAKSLLPFIDDLNNSGNLTQLEQRYRQGTTDQKIQNVTEWLKNKNFSETKNPEVLTEALSFAAKLELFEQASKDLEDLPDFSNMSVNPVPFVHDVNNAYTSLWGYTFVLQRSSALKSSEKLTAIVSKLNKINTDGRFYANNFYGLPNKFQPAIAYLYLKDAKMYLAQIDDLLQALIKEMPDEAANLEMFKNALENFKGFVNEYNSGRPVMSEKSCAVLVSEIRGFFYNIYGRDNVADGLVEYQQEATTHISMPTLFNGILANIAANMQKAGARKVGVSFQMQERDGQNGFLISIDNDSNAPEGELRGVVAKLNEGQRATTGGTGQGTQTIRDRVENWFGGHVDFEANADEASQAKSKFKTNIWLPVKPGYSEAQVLTQKVLGMLDTIRQKHPDKAGDVDKVKQNFMKTSIWMHFNLDLFNYIKETVRHYEDLQKLAEILSRESGIALDFSDHDLVEGKDGQGSKLNLYVALGFSQKNMPDAAYKEHTGDAAHHNLKLALEMYRQGQPGLLYELCADIINALRMNRSTYKPSFTWESIKQSIEEQYNSGKEIKDQNDNILYTLDDASKINEAFRNVMNAQRKLEDEYKKSANPADKEMLREYYKPGDNMAEHRRERSSMQTVEYEGMVHAVDGKAEESLSYDAGGVANFTNNAYEYSDKTTELTYNFAKGTVLENNADGQLVLREGTITVSINKDGRTYTINPGTKMKLNGDGTMTLGEGAISIGHSNGDISSIENGGQVPFVLLTRGIVGNIIGKMNTGNLLPNAFTTDIGHIMEVRKVSVSADVLGELAGPLNRIQGVESEYKTADAINSSSLAPPVKSGMDMRNDIVSGRGRLTNLFTQVLNQPPDSVYAYSITVRRIGKINLYPVDLYEYLLEYEGQAHRFEMATIDPEKEGYYFNYYFNDKLISLLSANSYKDLTEAVVAMRWLLHEAVNTQLNKQLGFYGFEESFNLSFSIVYNQELGPYLRVSKGAAYKDYNLKDNFDLEPLFILPLRLPVHLKQFANIQDFVETQQSIDTNL